ERKANGREVGETQISTRDSATEQKFHHNPQDFVDNLLITTGSSHARGQKLRRGANCLISLRSRV
ncbi:MAG TPA: hypothetical protein VK200_08860, partial [Candidatus Limnocylindrales bacterium]|nr:hypothetical protein [Candidatus Limnocylindrales bacterium]